MPNSSGTNCRADCSHILGVHAVDMVAKAAKISHESTHVHKHQVITHPKRSLDSLHQIHHEMGTGDTVWADIVKGLRRNTIVMLVVGVVFR